MKKISKIALAAIAATLSFTACNKADLVPSQEANAPKGNFSIFASISQDTKTVNDGMKTKWADNDSISVFHAAAGDTIYYSDGKFTLDPSAVASGRFEGAVVDSTISSSNDWYAFYPYDSHFTSPDRKTYFYLGCKNSNYTAQAQDGNSNMSHLAGQYFPLYAKLTDVANNSSVTLNFKPILSVIKFVVVNNTSKPLTVKNASITANQNIIGRFYVTIDGDAPSITPYSDYYCSNTASLNVVSGTAISVDDSACFYLAVAPFTNAEGSTLTFSVNGYEKTTKTAASFESGKIKTIRFAYDYVEAIQSIPYENATMSNFTIDDKEVHSNVGAVWTFASSYGYMKANSYSNSSAYESESWLLSPKIDLTTAIYPYLTFVHALNNLKGEDASDYISVCVKEYGDTEGQWETLNLTAYPAGNSWTKYDVKVSLKKYCGKVVRIGFKYTSDDVIAPTWEVQNFCVSEPVTTIQFSPDSISLAVGDSLNNNVKCNSPAEVMYTSSDPKVATVNNGLIKAISAGNCAIVASVPAQDGYAAASDTCYVTVTANAISYTKVTSELSDWSGEYVIAAVFNNKALAWTGIDAGHCHSDSLDIVDNSISGSNFITCVVAKVDGGYSVMVKSGSNNGKYISCSTSSSITYSNGLKFVSSPAAISITMENPGFVEMWQVVNASTNNGKRLYFLFNTSSGDSNDRFRFYKDTNLSSYLKPSLFKKD